MYIYSDSEEIQSPKRDTFYVELMTLAQFLNQNRLNQICDMYRQKNGVVVGTPYSQYFLTITELLGPGKLIECIAQLWKDTTTCDIEFEFGEQTIKAHKVYCLCSRMT